MIIALSLGLLAAILWGFHDICVRYVSQQGGIFPSIFMVLTFGLLFQIPVAFYIADWTHLDNTAFIHTLLSGLFFASGTISLYKGFAIGPVRLVAPIVGSYPALSIAHALWTGQSISIFQILAVFIIIGGIAIVARGDDDESNGSKSHAIFWGIGGAISFALSFAIGQTAAAGGAEITTITLARLASIILLITILLLSRHTRLPDMNQWPLLALMGLLDGSALALVLYAGTRPFSEFASVTASVFGLMTIILSWAILKEPMKSHQWVGVFVVFAAIASLAI